MQKDKKKNILILGMGKSGQSLAHFFHQKEDQVFGFDDFAQENTYQNFCPIYNKIDQVDFSKIDCLATSPGIKETHPVYELAKKHHVPILGEIEVGARFIKNRCVGITGTNGKSTTTSLIAHLIQASGQKARAIGNIGIPITSIINELDPEEILVIELSSYQIDQLITPFLELGVILNISEDHLDRYKTLERYAHSKFNIQKFIKKEGAFIFQKELQERWGNEIYFDEKICYDQPSSLSDFFFKEYPHFGPIESQNYLAALTVCHRLGFDYEKVAMGIQSFKGLEHRLEYVMKRKGISFYNDSKATNIEAVIKAVTSFEKPLILIMGGDDKGLDYSCLKAYFLDKVKHICVIGKVKEKMAETFGADFDTHLFSSLEEATKKAYELAESGDAILLSPGSSSFDMFKNFEHRGKFFKEVVQQLEGE